MIDAAYQAVLDDQAGARGDDLIDVVREIVPELESITERLKRHLDRLEEAERRDRLRLAPDPPTGD